MMNPNYERELVLQLPSSSSKDYEILVQLENCIASGLGTMGSVEGHDLGSGEMNIFVRTDEPRQVFERIKRLLGTGDFLPDMRAAHRKVGTKDFTVIHPDGLTDFKVA